MGTEQWGIFIDKGGPAEFYEGPFDSYLEAQERIGKIKENGESDEIVDDMYVTTYYTETWDPSDFTEAS